MIARFDGQHVTLEAITEEELMALYVAATVHCGSMECQADRLLREAHDLRELAARQPRGRVAKGRTAGELEAAAASCRDQAKLHADIARMLRPIIVQLD